MVDVVSIGRGVDRCVAVFERLVDVFSLLLFLHGSQRRIILNVLLHFGSFLIQQLLLGILLIIDRFARLMSVVNVDFADVERFVDVIGIGSGVNGGFTIFERLVNVGSLLILFRRG